MLKQKKKKLAGIPDEKTFREDVLSILFKKMGYEGVEITHGPDEHGKDLVFFEKDNKTGLKTYYAVVVKVGKITGGTGKDSAHVVNIKNQIDHAFNISYYDTFEKRKVNINQVWVVNNSTMSDKAKREIIERFGDTATFVERNVTFISESTLIDWIDKYWSDFYKSGDPFILEYCSKLKDRYEKVIELKSLGYQKEVRDLFDVYIEPTLVEEKKDITKQGKPIEFVERSTEEILKDKNNYWLTGMLGSGKSTILRKLLLNLIQGLEKDCSDITIPIILRFKELISDDTVLKIDEKIIDVLNKSNTYHRDIKPSEWLNDGKCMLFLDGFDEIYKHGLKDSVLDAVNEFMENYSTTKVIATSRELGLDTIESKLTTYHKLEIRPLTFKQMTKFMSLWFQGRDGGKEDMLEVLKKTVFANKLPKTPMVMTLLAILFDENPIKELPANLTELYSMFTQLYLGRWDTVRDVETLFTYNFKTNVLMNIATWMHEDGRDKVTEDAIKFQIEEYSKERQISVNSSALLDEIVNRTHLLYKDENEDYAFKHLSFQEYFSSLRWDQKFSNKDEILKYALNPWWENVMFFYVGKKKDAPEIIKGFIELPTKDISEKVNKILNLGQLLQAAYLTKHNIKVESVDFAIEHYCDLLPDLLKTMRDKSLKEKSNLSETFVILIMKYMFMKNYTSATLLSAIEEVFLKKKIEIESTDFKDKLTFMKAYLLAYMLAIIEKKEYIEELATHPSDYDPIFSLIMNLDFSELDKEYGINISKEAFKKIQKRVKKSSAYLRSQLKAK